jgi:hypothetical protein
LIKVKDGADFDEINFQPGAFVALGDCSRPVDRGLPDKAWLYPRPRADAWAAAEVHNANIEQEKGLR